MPTIILSDDPSVDFKTGWQASTTGESTRFWYYENGVYKGSVRQGRRNYDDDLLTGKWYWRSRQTPLTWHGPFETKEAAMAAFRILRNGK